MTRHGSPRGFAVLLLVVSCASGTLAQVKNGVVTTDILRAYLVATSDGEIVRDDSKTVWKATPTTQRPGTPVARLVATTARPLNPLDTLTIPPRILPSSECLVDFSDYDALNRLTYAPAGYPLYAEDGHAWSPWWFQACNGLDHATVRPVSPYSHFTSATKIPTSSRAPAASSTLTSFTTMARAKNSTRETSRAAW